MTELSKDELFRILSNSRRRQIIYFLHRAGDELTLKELAAMVAARENGTAVEDVTDEERQRVYISLYQTHLPKLEASDLVHYDEEERTVELVSDVARRGFFWMQTEQERPWHRYYGVVGLLGWVFIFGIWLGLPGFALIPWAAVAVLVSTLLVAVVLFQVYLDRDTAAPSDAFETLVE